MINMIFIVTLIKSLSKAIDTIVGQRYENITFSRTYFTNTFKLISLQSFIHGSIFDMGKISRISCKSKFKRNTR